MLKNLLLSGILLFSAFLVQAQNYCIPNLTYGYSGNYIYNFSLHTLKNYHSKVPGYAYSEYYKTQFTTNLNIGERYPLTITSEYNSGANKKFIIWIDYNDNHVFDVLEKVYEDTIGTSTVFTYLNIPLDTTIVGEKRMRVMGMDMSKKAEPCGTFTLGVEVEDYTINITKGAPHEETELVPLLNARTGFADLHNFSINTLKNFGSGNNKGGYVFYNDTNLFYTTLYKGNAYKGYISKEVSSGVSVNFYVWIDLNMDGWLNTNELLFKGYGDKADFTITIPDTLSKGGIARLRTMAIFSGTTSAYTYGDGEAEDYWVYLSTDKPTGIENTALQNISVYPNPFTEEITINGFDGEEVSATLVNTLGQKVLKTKIVANSTLNTEGLPAGVYILQIEDKEGFVRSLRVVKE